MTVDADWKGLYHLLNDLVRQKDTHSLMASLETNIDSVIPANRGAPFFTFVDGKPICRRWPLYSSPLIPAFNTHYNQVCPAKCDTEQISLGPVNWKSEYSNSEYDTDFNRPLNVGHSMGAGFVKIGTGRTHILVVNRGRSERPFSERDMKNLKTLVATLSVLYCRLDKEEDEFAANLRRLESLSGYCPLSRRETVVCRMFSNRMTARNIGELLKISPRTVERHVLNIYNKLNVSNRRELIELIRP